MDANQENRTISDQAPNLSSDGAPMIDDKTRTGDESPLSESNGSPTIDEKPKETRGGMSAFFSKMGNLPEWKMGGRKLEGKSLNWSIGFIASCGFLMFGYAKYASRRRRIVPDWLFPRRSSYSVLW
jgi:hypothetical protein